MSIQVGVFLAVVVVAVVMFIKTHRAAPASTISLGHSEDSSPRDR